MPSNLEPRASSLESRDAKLGRGWQASKISDLPFCGKFTKLYSTGLLVDGRVFS